MVDAKMCDGVFVCKKSADLKKNQTLKHRLVHKVAV